MPKEQSNIKAVTAVDNIGNIHEREDSSSLQLLQFCIWKCLALQLALFHSLVLHE